MNWALGSPSLAPIFRCRYSGRISEKTLSHRRSGSFIANLTEQQDISLALLPGLISNWRRVNCQNRSRADAGSSPHSLRPSFLRDTDFGDSPFVSEIAQPDASLDGLIAPGIRASVFAIPFISSVPDSSSG